MPTRPNPLLAPEPRSNPLLDSTPAMPIGGRTNPLLDSESTSTETPDDATPWGVAALGGGALAALGYALTKNPGLAKSLGGRAASLISTVRNQEMLSGLAPLKSFLGNVGAAIETSLENKSLNPLREFFSPETLRDVAATYKANPAPPGTRLPDWLPTPGRIMESFDSATQAALRRAGLAPDVAERAVLQSPLEPRLAKALDNPVARYVVPFRRTPFNQFSEGFATMGENPLLSAGYAGVGALHGAATADEQYPVTLPLGISLAARRGVSYGLGSMAGRMFAGGKGAGATASSLLPVSEYGITQSLEDPLKPFTEPAALAALKKILE